MLLLSNRLAIHGGRQLIVETGNGVSVIEHRETPWLRLQALISSLKVYRSDPGIAA
jgi:hypothetical protein